MYLYELPTTGEVVFADFLLASSPHLVTQLAHATELRARIRALLKANRADDATAHSTRDWLTIAKAADDYLPYLCAIYNCLQTDDLLLKYEPEFAWRTAFSASSSPLRIAAAAAAAAAAAGAPPRIAIRSIHYELASVLLLSATALSNLATSIIAALGTAYERDRSLSDTQRRAKDDKLKTAADLLCRASGIFDYLASSFIPSWENAVGRIDPRPPETTQELARALAKLSLADAQALAIRKLLSPSVALAEDTITPGPPLPKTHPSPSLLAKLHLETCALYESAEQLARLAGSKRAGTAGNSSSGGSNGGGEGGGGMALGASASGRVGGSGGARAIEPPPAVVAARLAGGGGEYPRGGGLGQGAGYEGSDDGSSSNQGPAREGGAGGGLFASPGKSPNGKPSRLLNFAQRLGGGGGGGAGASPPTRPGSSDTPPPSSGGSSTYSHPGVTPTLLDYLSTNALFARAQAYRWLALDCGEQRSAYGEALAYLALARDELEDGDSSSSSKADPTSSSPSSSSSKKPRSKLAQKLADLSSSASLTPKRSRELRAELKAKSALELRDVTHWTRAYAKLNDTLAFLPIPPRADVLSKIPAGRAVLSAKKYALPTPAFGPGSVSSSSADGDGLLGEGVRRLGFGHAEDELDVLVRGGGGGGGGYEAGAAPPPPPEGSLLGTERKKGADADKGAYAGAGAYY
ncbi:hypothetical protein OC844_000037 [Tilletia horrida]|nr:hypothetical protein OC844_000037 [Tilletia horrida]